MNNPALPFPKPDAGVIREAISSDAVIQRILQRHDEAEAARLAQVQASTESVSKELVDLCKQRQTLSRRIAFAQKSLRLLKRQARKRELPARFKRQINKRKESIRARERQKFLRQWQIQFDRETRNI
jgi:hypothetical protein